jgi:hypothetical protein
VKPKRRWTSLSLRTLLLGVTLFSMVCAWLLHYRRGMHLARERFETTAPRGVKLTFRDSLLGLELPEGPTVKTSQSEPSPQDAWRFVRWFAGPRLHEVAILNTTQLSRADGFQSLVQDSSNIRLQGCDVTDQVLRQWVSPHTAGLEIIPQSGYLGTKGLTCLEQAPNLKRLRLAVYYFGQGYGAQCLRSVFSHRSLEEVEVWPDVADLSAVPAVGTPLRLRVLKLKLHKGEPAPADHEFAWLQDCRELCRIELAASEQSSFLQQAIRRCPKLTELAIENLSDSDCEVISACRTLRRIELRGLVRRELLDHLVKPGITSARVTVADDATVVRTKDALSQR